MFKHHQENTGLPKMSSSLQLQWKPTMNSYHDIQGKYTKSYGVKLGQFHINNKI